MILTFKCADTESLFQRNRVKRFANFEAIALRKLTQLHAASTLGFMRAPPGNRLEALAGPERTAQHSHQ